jgi:hypothetical protein
VVVVGSKQLVELILVMAVVMAEIPLGVDAPLAAVLAVTLGMVPVM